MKTKNGFSLIELMIVLVVIGILARVAVPSYIEYVTRGKLLEATSTLPDGRVKMEQFFQDNRTYVGGPTPASTTNFTYSATNLTLTTYSITATGTGSVSAYSYRIDQSNTKASNTPWGNSTSCWVVRKGGVC
jgi:type IV pilus assembly protein PilE